MKKLSILLGILLFCGQIVFADEVMPEQSANDNRATIAVQKQPANEQQKQEVKNNWFCIILQVNGKVKDISDSDIK